MQSLLPGDVPEDAEPQDDGNDATGAAESLGEGNLPSWPWVV